MAVAQASIDLWWAGYTANRLHQFVKSIYRSTASTDLWWAGYTVNRLHLSAKKWDMRIHLLTGEMKGSQSGWSFWPEMRKVGGDESDEDRSCLHLVRGDHPNQLEETDIVDYPTPEERYSLQGVVDLQGFNRLKSTIELVLCKRIRCDFHPPSKWVCWPTIHSLDPDEESKRFTHLI